ncbi:Long-chain-fatty-acid--CoA ligase [Streptomyces xiamenensis]|uniref:Long-chain-fatty-acid--CoA ligase n=1 Tax=Streptomyces xiamenensis TaxID=408015 RepID=A0A0F7FVA4_9ACTN|nr:non-ribosomal peptide synthetase [Streptomyces xiamenensis]AKG43794.1 Long-chain-fatty-acid--CoA ligase [Streptomyces xiamenensis]
MSLDACAIAVLGPDTDPGTFTDHSFLALGGDSLRAMRLAALARERLGVRLSLSALLDRTPLAGVFAEAVAAAPPGGPVTAAPETDAAQPVPAALSPAQRGMWLIERLTGDSPYHLVFVCHVTAGRLEAAPLAAALAQTAARHPGLRTVYREHDDEAVPEVLADHTPEVETLTLGPSTTDTAGTEAAVRRAAEEFGRRPFDLAAAPAHRYLLIEDGTGGQALVLTAHHMVLDGWSVGLLLEEVIARYGALTAGTPAPSAEPGVAPQALARHQAAARDGGDWERQAEFWVKHLDGVPTVLEVPADRPRPALQDPAGARAPLDLGAAASEAVAARAREAGVTPFALLLAAFALTLARRTGVRSLLVGVPLTGRDTSELEKLVAVAGNLVPVRVDVDDDASVDDYLRSVHHSLGLAIDAGGLPFEELASRLGVERALGHHPLVQVSFGMHDQLVPQRLRTADVELRVEEAHGGGAQFDLSLLIGRSDPTLAGHLEYATGVFDAAEVEGLLADLTAAVAGLTSDGGTPLADVRCLAPERRALLERLNDVRRDFPARSVDALFRATAARTPDAIAVRDGATELTYRALAQAADEQTRRLRRAGVRPGDRVLVALPRSAAEAVALLGVAAAGAAYVGVDLDQASEHTARIVDAAAPRVALATPRDAPRLAALGVPTAPAWDPSSPPEDTGTDGDGDGAADGGPSPVTDDQPVYVAFTSGSTGRPKGVQVPHRAVVRLVHEADFVRLGPGERVLRLSPLAFDASTLEIWGALLSGATLEVLPPGLPAPTDLGEFLAERGVTVAWLTAGLFRLVEEFAADTLGGLRQLLTGGDVVPHEHVARLLRRHPGLEITNGYGPTENTTFTTTHTVRTPEEADGPLPIGTPVPGTRVYVLDDRRRLVPPGGVGELYTGGAGLADGYLHDEAETARAFGAFSPDVPERLYRTGDLVRVDGGGRVRFLGRRDSQVKLRGYRVELSAISDELTRAPGVRDAVVAVTEGDSAGKQLIAAVVPEPGTIPDTARLRDLLAQRLPSYMVPVLWAVLDRVPLTPNGKVDRRALAAAAGPAGTTAPPAPSTTPAPVSGPGFGEVAAVFAESLRDKAVDPAPGTDFFRAGGNSLAAVRLVRLVRDRFGVSVPLRDFLRTPTPEGLHRLVTDAAAEPAGGPARGR